MNKYKVKEYELKDLMSMMSSGEFVIPNFQRNFVWKPNQILSLMESISKVYPIGILTIAPSKGSVFSEGKNEAIDLIKNKSNDNFIVIDGQQRLTSLSMVYYAYELNSLKMNASEETKKYLTKLYDDIYYYNKKFISKKDITKRMVESGMKKDAISKKIKIFSIANPDTAKEIKEVIDSYSIQVLMLNNWDDEQLIDIFTAMNNGAKKLTHVDLMNGLMFSKGDGFDLLKSIKEFNAGVSGLGKIKGEYYVQLLKIYFDIKNKQNVSYSKKSLMAFANNKAEVLLFKEWQGDFNLKLMESLKLLDNNFDIYSIDLLPKNVYLSVALALSVYYSTNDKVLDQKVLYKSIEYITRRLINNDYASSPGVKVQDDINNHVLKLAKGKEVFVRDELTLIDKKLLASRVKALTYTNKDAALFKLIIAVISSQNPKMFFSKGNVPVRATKISPVDTQLHHFIPKKSSFVKEYGIDEKRLNRPGNITLITKNENQNIIRNKDLDEYLGEVREVKGTEYSTVLDSHLFNEVTLSGLEKIIIDDPENSIRIHESVDKIFEDREQLIIDELWKRFLK